MNQLPPGFECDAPPEGCYSPSEQYWTIRPRAEYKYDAGREWFCIGGPGVDGIEFGLMLRVAHAGLVNDKKERVTKA